MPGPCFGTHMRRKSRVAFDDERSIGSGASCVNRVGRFGRSGPCMHGRDQVMSNNCQTERTTTMQHTILKILTFVAIASVAPAFAQDAGHRQELDKATIEKVFKEPG